MQGAFAKSQTDLHESVHHANETCVTSPEKRRCP